FVPVAEDSTAGDSASVGPPLKRVISPLPGAAPLEAGGQRVEDRGYLTRLVGEADRRIAEVRADLDTGLLDLHDGRWRANGVAADARKLGDDEHVEWRVWRKGREKRIEPRAVLPFGTAAVLVREDIARVYRPALGLSVGRRVLDLPRGRPDLVAPVAVIAAFPRIDTASHRILLR